MNKVLNYWRLVLRVWCGCWCGWTQRSQICSSSGCSRSRCLRRCIVSASRATSCPCLTASTRLSLYSASSRRSLHIQASCRRLGSASCAVRGYYASSRPPGMWQQCRFCCLSNALHSSIGHNIKSPASPMSGDRCPMSDVWSPVEVWKTSNGQGTNSTTCALVVLFTRRDAVERVDVVCCTSDL